jgi:inosose dehydratase
VLDGSVRTCKALTAHGAKHLVLIDSISPRRAPTAGRADEAEQMDQAEWAAYRDRIAHVAKMGAEEYGLTVGIHAHAGGFMDFEPELERLLDEVDESILKICFDTGHHSYAGFDPVAFMKRHINRISYMHFKDIDPKVKADVIANRTGFYDACGQGIFCNLGEGDVDFPKVRQILLDAGFEGWCTVEQDCDPTLGHRPARRRTGQPRLSRNPSVSNKDRTHAKLNWGMIGGGEGSQIGPAHRLGAMADGHFAFAAGALDHGPRRAAPMRQRLGIAR